MEKSIKTIVFDYGGVLEFSRGGNPMVIASEITGISIDELKEKYFTLNHLSNIENMDWLDMFTLVLSTFSLSEEIISKTIKAVSKNNNNVTLNEELITHLSVLKQLGLNIAIFSNYTSALRNRLIENGLSALFDKVVVSGEIGFQKPDKEAFKILFKEINSSPQEVIFIDDSPKSLETAPDIGYHSILFKNNDQLFLELKRFRIDLV